MESVGTSNLIEKSGSMQAAANAKSLHQQREEAGSLGSTQNITEVKPNATSVFQECSDQPPPPR